MAEFLIELAIEKLLCAVISTTEKALVFEEELKSIKEKLDLLGPLIKKMEEINKKRDGSWSSTGKFNSVIENGYKLVAKCESVSKLNLRKRSGHTKKLRKLEKSLVELRETVQVELNLLILDKFEDSPPNIEPETPEDNDCPPVSQPPTSDVGFDPLKVHNDNEIQGAVLEEAFQELFNKLVDVIGKAVSWKQLLQNIKAKVEDLKPMVKDTIELSRELKQIKTTDFKKLISKATELVGRYTNHSKSKNVNKNSHYTKSLRELNEFLDQWLKLHRAYQSKDLEEFRKLGVLLQKSVERLNWTEKLKQRQISSTRCCEVPEAPDFTVGLDATLEELKAELLREDSSVLVLTAPPGCGKTTLVQKLCKANEIKEKFKENIMFVKVSKTADLNLIIQSLYQHNSRTVPVFQDEKYARSYLRQLLEGIGPSPILLVLDDVSSEAEYLVDKCRFEIPEYKILVTSIHEIPAYGPKYKLRRLNHEDAEALSVIMPSWKMGALRFQRILSKR